MLKFFKIFGNLFLMFIAFIVFILSLSIGGFLIDTLGNDFVKEWILYSPNGLAVFALVITVLIIYIIKKGFLCLKV